MNFLNSVCLASYARTALWNAPCCRDTMRISALVCLQTSHQKKCLKPIRAENGKIKGLQTNICKNSLSRSILLTQVRFSKNFPRFHRDLEPPSFDDYRKDQFLDIRKTSWGQGDEKVGYSYFLAFAAGVVALYGVKSEVRHFVTYMAAAADVMALASVEVKLSDIAAGSVLVIKWRGKPLFIKHRTQADIALEAGTPLGSLRHPEAPETRAQNPQWLVVIGICTHLGCVPMVNLGDFAGGFYCPCHGSHYDNLGRIRKGPAPANLEVPPYKFIDDNNIVVGS